MEYKQQATNPDWWNTNSDCIRIAATSGTSPFNEWYQFESREEGLSFIQETFNSQTYIDNFAWIDGEIYDVNDIIWNSDEPEVKNNAAPAELIDVIKAESKF